MDRKSTFSILPIRLHKNWPQDQRVQEMNVSRQSSVSNLVAERTEARQSTGCLGADRTESRQPPGYVVTQRTDCRQSSWYLGAERTEFCPSAEYLGANGLSPASPLHTWGPNEPCQSPGCLGGKTTESHQSTEYQRMGLDLYRTGTMYIVLLSLLISMFCVMTRIYPGAQTYIKWTCISICLFLQKKMWMS